MSMSIKSYLYLVIIRRRLKACRLTSLLLRDFVSRAQKEEYQVERFNAVWQDAIKHVPFYNEWQVKYKLPAKIQSLKELQGWPVLTKDDLRKQDLFIRRDCKRPTGMIITGGSTGAPVRLPSYPDNVTGVSQVIGRRWYGICPGDSTFLLWGHEHLYGTGIKRKINALKRRFKDWLAGWKRVSAYDLGFEAMQKAYDAFAKHQPKFVIGFSPAVLAFVRQNAEKSGLVKCVKVVLCTAGPLSADEKREIEAFFNAKVCMEYGSVECGVMAYTRPTDGQYNVFWNTHLLQSQKQEGGEFKNLVTRLTKTYVPLIRYDIGDYLELDKRNEVEDSRAVYEILSVKGRPSEMLRFSCGVSFFGALIGDCVKQVPEIISSQMAVNEEKDLLEVRVTSNTPLKLSDYNLIKNRIDLTINDADKLQIKIVQVEKLFTTSGGKIPRIVRI